MSRHSQETELLTREEIDTSNGDNANKKLIILNDPINTFDHVIDVLIRVLDYQHKQANQLTLLIHYSGKAIVKTGPENIINKYYDQLKAENLTVTIEN